MSKQKSEVTVEAVKRVIQDGKLTSLTQVSKSLGFGKGSVSGSVAKRLRELVPAIDDMFASNKAAKDGDAGGATPKVGKKSAKQPADRKPAGTAEHPMPDCVPYRPSSGYAMVWSILYAYRDKGINKRDLIAKYRAWCKKPQKNCEFDAHVVASAREDGSSHRSASRAAQYYWVERENDWLKLHLLSEKK